MDIPHVSFFFFNDTATTEIYTLSLHDALPISDTARPGCTWDRAARLSRSAARRGDSCRECLCCIRPGRIQQRDRKSTRLNSSHANISYAVFCLKKKKSRPVPDSPGHSYRQSAN